jgi:hypothetical protein
MTNMMENSQRMDLIFKLHYEQFYSTLTTNMTMTHGENLMHFQDRLIFKKMCHLLKLFVRWKKYLLFKDRFLYVSYLLIVIFL